MEKKKYEKKVMFNNRPHFRGKNCDFCHKLLKEPFKLMEIQSGWFRGDDDVYAFHIECPYEVVDNDINQANDMVDGKGDMIDMDLINGGE